MQKLPSIRYLSGVLLWECMILTEQDLGLGEWRCRGHPGGMGRTALNSLGIPPVSDLLR